MYYPCEVCQKQAYRSPRHRERTKLQKVFCSRACLAKYMTGPNHHRYDSFVRNCETCGTQILVEIGRAKTQRYCSHACRGVSIRGERLPRTEIMCGHCGKTLRLVPREVGVKKFCSRYCSSRLHHYRMRGAKNPNWIDGSAGKGYTELFVRMKKKVRRREGYCCLLCGKTQQDNGRALDVHHVDWDKSNDCMQNYAALCRNCHMGLQGRRKKRQRQAERLLCLLSERYGYPTRSITLK